MIFSLAGGDLRKTVFVLLNIILLTISAAYGADSAEKSGWKERWNNLVIEAKKEKSALVYIGSTGAVLKKPITDAFKQKFDIDLEFIVGRGASIAEKIFTERRAGLFLGDVVFQGSTVQLQIFKPKDALEALDPFLILPEVTNPKVWLGERFPFLDKDHKVISFFSIRQNYMARNTKLVGEGEVKSFDELLQPKWKGQIIMFDPTISGSGSGWYSLVYSLLGKEKTTEFMRQFVKQEPMVTRDDRVLIEGLSRGKYKIAIGYSEAPFLEFKRNGAPIEIIRSTEENFVSSGGGAVSILKNAPHRNTAILFLNWLLTNEAQTIVSKSSGLPSARTDVPTTGLEPYNVLPPGEKFHLEQEEDILRKDELMLKAKDIFAHLLK